MCAAHCRRHSKQLHATNLQHQQDVTNTSTSTSTNTNTNTNTNGG